CPEHAVTSSSYPGCEEQVGQFLMVEHFLEQFPVIQVASMDPRFTKSMEEDRYPKAYSVTSVKFVQSCQ
ncbi:hypothetical protein ABVT39_025911, partial [Epinephelus coioides]